MTQNEPIIDRMQWVYDNGHQVANPAVATFCTEGIIRQEMSILLREMIITSVIRRYLSQGQMITD